MRVAAAFLALLAAWPAICQPVRRLEPVTDQETERTFRYPVAKGNGWITSLRVANANGPESGSVWIYGTFGGSDQPAGWTATPGTAVELPDVHEWIGAADGPALLDLTIGCYDCNLDLVRVVVRLWDQKGHAALAPSLDRERILAVPDNFGDAATTLYLDGRHGEVRAVWPWDSETVIAGPGGQDGEIISYPVPSGAAWIDVEPDGYDGLAWLVQADDTGGLVITQ